MASCRFVLFIVILLISFLNGGISRKLNQQTILKYRDRVSRMFHHAYNGYLMYAYPLDELRPLTCDGHDTWGSYSLTLIDALDTLAVVGNYTEFRRVAKLLEETLDFDRDINVSVFETNIRVVGGLLSGHLLSLQAGVDLDPGWPCTGPLLRLAEQVARKLLPAFNTSTGMPYGTVNLQYGVPKGETPVTCTAGVGTFIVEFGALTQLTGLPIYLDTALRALHSLWTLKSPIGLVGNHVDVMTGKWTALDSGIGAGVDSYFEYLVKGAVLFQYPQLMEMFQEYKQVLTKYVKREDWYMWAHKDKGTITLPIFQSLEAFWPGLLSLTGDVDSAMKTLHNYHQIWRQYGFVPEFYNIPKAEAQVNREGYPLRPELIESTMYLYHATKDPYLLEVAVDILESIEHSTRTPCGYATVKNVRDHQLENRMESFFLAETTKYLYLIFDQDNFIHNSGGRGTVITTPGGDCIVNAGGYVFNTEAHPIDAASLYCCSAEKSQDESAVEEAFGDVDLLRLMGVHEAKGGKDVIKKQKQEAEGGFTKTEETVTDTEMEEEEGGMEESTVGEELEKKREWTMEETTLKTTDTVNPGNDLIEANSEQDEKMTYPIEAENEKINDALATSTVEQPPINDNNLTSDQLPSDTNVDQSNTGSPLQILPPNDECRSDGASTSAEGVTMAPLDLWTFQRSIHNHTEMERVNGLFTCPTRPFHARWSLMGEMFIDE